MTNASEYVKAIQEKLHEKDQNQTEFLQAIDEFLPTIIPFLEKHPEYIESNLVDLLTEPERFIQFRVPWQDDQGIRALQRRPAFSSQRQLKYLEIFGF